MCLEIGTFTDRHGDGKMSFPAYHQAKPRSSSCEADRTATSVWSGAMFSLGCRVLSYHRGYSRSRFASWLGDVRGIKRSLGGLVDTHRWWIDDWFQTCPLFIGFLTVEMRWWSPRTGILFRWLELGTTNQLCPILFVIGCHSSSQHP